MFSPQYECFNGDFFDQTSDTKEILQSLNSSLPLNNLNLDSPGQYLTNDLVPYDPNSPAHGGSLISSDNCNGLNVPQLNHNSNNKYTDYIDGKFDGLMSTMWTLDISKNSPLLSEIASDIESRYWESKPPEQWTSEDVWHWIFSWAGDHNVDIEDVQPLAYANMTGQQLCQMSKSDFISMNPKYGYHIYETLSQLVCHYRKYSLFVYQRSNQFDRNCKHEVLGHSPC